MNNLKNLDGAKVEAGIHVSTTGCTVLTGEAIGMMQLISLKQALELQAHGIKFSRHLPAATTMARNMLGIKGNRERLLEQVNAIIGRVQEEREIAAREVN